MGAVGDSLVMGVDIVWVDIERGFSWGVVAEASTKNCLRRAIAEILFALSSPW